MGSPSEDAFNAYISAYNAWNDCIGMLGCTEKTVDAQLQVQRTKATGLIEQVRNAAGFWLAGDTRPPGGQRGYRSDWADHGG